MFLHGGYKRIIQTNKKERRGHLSISVTRVVNYNVMIARPLLDPTDVSNWHSTEVSGCHEITYRSVRYNFPFGSRGSCVHQSAHNRAHYFKLEKENSLKVREKKKKEK